MLASNLLSLLECSVRFGAPSPGQDLAGLSTRQRLEISLPPKKDHHSMWNCTRAIVQLESSFGESTFYLWQSFVCFYG